MKFHSLTNMSGAFVYSDDIISVLLIPCDCTFEDVRYVTEKGLRRVKNQLSDITYVWTCTE